MTMRTLYPRDGECQAEYRAGFAGMRRCTKPALLNGFCKRHGEQMRRRDDLPKVC